MMGAPGSMGSIPAIGPISFPMSTRSTSSKCHFSGIWGTSRLVYIAGSGSSRWPISWIFARPSAFRKNTSSHMNRKRTLIFFLLALCVAPATAQLTCWPAGSGRVDMGKQVAVLEDKRGMLTIDSVAEPADSSHFAPSWQSILHFGFTNSIIWLRFTIDNPTKDSLLLELDHAFIPTADLYFKDTTGHWIVTYSGFHVPLPEKPIANDAQVFPLPGGRHEFYLRMQPYIHAIPVTLWEKSRYHVKESREKLIYGIYTGLLLFAIAINLFLFYTFRRGYDLNYSILVFLYILSSALVMEGYAVYFFPNIDLMFWYRIVPVLDMPALLFYCLSFLEVKKYAPGLHRFCFITCFV